VNNGLLRLVGAAACRVGCGACSTIAILLGMAVACVCVLWIIAGVGFALLCEAVDFFVSAARGMKAAAEGLVARAEIGRVA